MPFLPSLDRNGNLGEEVPVTATPIFEGHLSVRTDRKHWQWRLFRFDGSNFTCLSTRKVKLPPNTEVHNTTSFYSLTSPLLATPKDKNKRLVEEKTELKYYQLPEWTVDVVNISSISVLKRAKKTTASKCFSIRTFQGQCFVLKAHKQKDLERWLFVLTKMWKFTQAVRDQVMQQQQQQQQPFYYPTQQQAMMAAVEDNTPLAHTIQPTTYDAKYRSPTLSSEKIRVIEEWRKSLAELMANDPCIKVSSPPPIEPIPDDDTMSVFTDMTSVSNRPKSTTVKRKTTGSNLVGSKRSTSRSLRRNKTNSIAPASSSQQQQQQQHQEMPLEGRLVPTLRKRRSDDVRNWMNSSLHSNSRPLGRTASIGSNRKPMIQKVNNNGALSISTNNYYHPMHQHAHGSSVSTSPEIIQHMNFFQDVVTVCDDDTCNNHHGNSHSNNPTQLRYHTSVRGKKLIQINQGDENHNGTKAEERRNSIAAADVIVVAPTLSSESALNKVKQVGVDIKNNGKESSSNQDILQQRPIKTIIRRASMPLTDDNLLLQQQYQYQQQYLNQQKINSLQSPLQFLSSSNSKQKVADEEDISLADLQKSLRQISLHHRSPSASSIQDLQKRPYSSIVAPAIPPHQYKQPYLFDTTHYHEHGKSADKQPFVNHDIYHPHTNNIYN